GALGQGGELLALGGELLALGGELLALSGELLAQRGRGHGLSGRRRLRGLGEGRARRRPEGERGEDSRSCRSERGARWSQAVSEDEAAQPVPEQHSLASRAASPLLPWHAVLRIGQNIQ